MASKQKNKKKFSWKVVLGIAVLCGLAVGLTVVGNAIQKDKAAKAETLPAVATVNGYPVTAREVQTRLTNGRGYIRNYFETTYNAVKEDASFWDTAFEGVTPMEYGRNYYYREALRVKMTQILALQYGLTDHISYGDFVIRWQEENARRQEIVNSGGQVPGLLQYSESDYFEIEFSTLEEKLFDAMVKKGLLPVTDAEKQAYYQENRERQFKKQDHFTFEVVTAAIFPGTEDGEDPAALAAIEAFEDRLKAGEDFADLAAKVEKGEFPGLTYTVVEVDDDTDLLELEKVTGLLNCAAELELGQVSPLLVSKFYYYTIGRCTAYEDMGYAEYEDMGVQNGIEYILQTQKFRAYIDEQVKKAKIVLDEEQYNRITLPEKYR